MPTGKSRVFSRRAVPKVSVAASKAATSVSAVPPHRLWPPSSRLPYRDAPFNAPQVSQRKVRLLQYGPEARGPVAVVLYFEPFAGFGDDLAKSIFVDVECQRE